MDITDIITNPIVIGLFAGLLTYIYMRWRNEKKDKRDKKNKKDINLLIPFSVFIVFWFISYAYFSSYEESDNIQVQNNNINNDINIKIKPTNYTNNQISETSEPVSFNLISKTNNSFGVNIPDNLPDILFEMN